MQYKRFLLLFLTLCLFCPSVRALDRGFTQISDTAEQAELEALKPALLEEINQVFESRGMTPLAPEELDLHTMFPYYQGDNYFSTEIRSAEDFLARVEAQEHYLWLLPLRVDDRDVLVGIGRGYPLREEAKEVLNAEQIAEVEANAGKWQFVWMQYDGGADWKTTALAQDPDADQIVLINGRETTNAVMAVCIKENRLTEVIAVEDALISIRKEDVAAINAVTDLATAEGTIELRRGDRFTYEEMQQTLGRLIENKNILSAGGGAAFRLEGNSTGQGVVLIAAAILLAFVIVFVRRRKVR